MTCRRCSRRFPSDGHSLLTAATVRGSGPDPKKIIKALEKDSDEANKGQRGGQIVGALIQAQNKRDGLESELSKATTADQEFYSRRAQLTQSKSQRDQIKSQLQGLESELKRLDNLEKLLEPALKHMAVCEQMVQQQTEWDNQEEEIALARKDLATLKKEYEQYRIQYRVARDQELGGQLDAAEKQIKRAQALEAACTELERDLKSKKRPSAANAKAYQALQERIKVASGKMEATGVRYQLAAEGRPAPCGLPKMAREKRKSH